MYIFPIFSLSLIPPYLSKVPASRLMQAYLLYDTHMIMCNWLAIKTRSYHGQRFLFFLRWNSWRAFLVEVSGHKLESFQTPVFSGFLPFPFYKMLFMKRLELSCFADLFERIFKSREGYGFLWNPPVERIVNSRSKRLESFVKLKLKDSISVFYVILHSYFWKNCVQSQSCFLIRGNVRN